MVGYHSTKFFVFWYKSTENLKSCSTICWKWHKKHMTPLVNCDKTLQLFFFLIFFIKYFKSFIFKNSLNLFWFRFFVCLKQEGSSIFSKGNDRKHVFYGIIWFRNYNPLTLATVGVLWYGSSYICSYVENKYSIWVLWVCLISLFDFYWHSLQLFTFLFTLLYLI